MHQATAQTRAPAAVRSRRTLFATLAALVLAGPTGAQAAMTFTDVDAYLTAISSGFEAETVEGFDDVTAPQTIADGGSFGDLTFDLSSLGVDLTVLDVTDDTASNANALGAAGDTFLGGDGFSMSLADPVRAFGLFIITADNLADDDVSLSAGGETAQLAAADAITDPTLSNEYDFASGTSSLMFFLGITAAADFSDVSLSSAGNTFSFSIDDVRYAAATPAPAPASWLLLSAGLGLLALRRRR